MFFFPHFSLSLNKYVLFIINISSFLPHHLKKLFSGVSNKYLKVGLYLLSSVYRTSQKLAKSRTKKLWRHHCLDRKFYCLGTHTMFTTLTTMFLFRHNRLVSGQMLNKCTLNLFTLLIILTTRQTFIYIYSYLHTYTRENSVLLQSQDERYMLWPSNSFLCCRPWKSLVFYCLFYIYNRNTSRIKDCSKKSHRRLSKKSMYNRPQNLN